MTIRVYHQSLWRGLIPGRRSLAALARERGDDVARLRLRNRQPASVAALKAFVVAAIDEGHSLSDIGRFVERSHCTIIHHRNRAAVSR